MSLPASVNFEENGDARAVRDTIIAFLKEKAPHQVEAIDRLKTTTVIWGHVDSLLVLGLVSRLEQTYSIKFPPSDFTPENLATLENLVGYVLRARAQ